MLCLAVVLVSCAEPPASTAASTIDEAVDWSRDVHLEEDTGTITVLPRVTVPPTGGLLIADRAEAQVRWYTDAGRLTSAVGRAGQGPGEFEQLIVAVSTPAGEVFAVERSGRLTQLTSSGELVRVHRLPITNVSDMRALTDSRLLIAGQRTDVQTSERLHVWDIANLEVIHSFFIPPDRSAGGSISVAIGPGGDRIVAAFGLSDSIYVFSAGGRLERKVRVPAQHFRPYADPETRPPPEEATRPSHCRAAQPLNAPANGLGERACDACG